MSMFNRDPHQPLGNPNEVAREHKDKDQAAQIAHESAKQTTILAARQVRRDPSPDNVNDLLDAIEDERLAAKEAQDAAVSAVLMPIMAKLFETPVD